MKTFRVTKLEKQVLEALASLMYEELGFSDAGHLEVAEATGLTPRVIRGVASSLVKKGLIDIDDREGEGYKNNPEMHIWYLREKVMGLVPHWVGQEDWLTKFEIEEVVLEEQP
jgi:hypothetical protein